jgi:hypothetical protein
MAVCAQNMATITVTLSKVFWWVYYNNLPTGQTIPANKKHLCFVSYLHHVLRRQQAGVLLPPGSF